jgi:hypothetical protein
MGLSSAVFTAQGVGFKNGNHSTSKTTSKCGCANGQASLQALTSDSGTLTEHVLQSTAEKSAVFDTLHSALGFEVCCFFMVLRGDS